MNLIAAMHLSSDEATQSEEPQTNANIPVVSQQLVAMITDDLRDQSSQAYALYHRIIKEEDGDSPESFEVNSVYDNDAFAPRKSENLDDELQTDWDTSETQADDSRDSSLVKKILMSILIRNFLSIFYPSTFFDK